MRKGVRAPWFSRVDLNEVAFPLQTPRRDRHNRVKTGFVREYLFSGLTLVDLTWEGVMTRC